MSDRLIAALARWRDWQLNTLIVALTVGVADGVVALVEVGLFGGTDQRTLLISTLSSLIIASLMVNAIAALRRRLEALSKQQLAQAFEPASGNLALSIEVARMVFWELDLRTGALRYDPGKLTWLGLDDGSAPLTMTDWVARIHPEDRAVFTDRYVQALAPGAPDFDCEYRMSATAGAAYAWVHTRGRIKARAADGQALLAVGGTLNIDQRKQAELALREAKDRLDVIFNKHPELMLISRLTDGLITEVNDAFEVMSGYSRAEAIGNTTLGLGLWSHAPDRERMTRDLRARGRCDGLETVFVTHSGERVESQLDAVAATIHGVPHIVCVVRDIRQRLRAEAARQALTDQLQAQQPVFEQPHGGRAAAHFL